MVFSNYETEFGVESIRPKLLAAITVQVPTSWRTGTSLELECWRLTWPGRFTFRAPASG